jgi:hypothetical protein
MQKTKKVKILDITYEREHNLFQMKVQEINSQKEVVMAIKGIDWGVTPEVTDEVVEQFCNDMRGKEKNLFIETDDASVTEARKTKEEDELISQEKLDSINQNIDNYPINEVMNSITNEEKNDN